MSDSDNVLVDPGERPNAFTVATDEIGGTHYPIYKMSVGPLGSQIPVSEEDPLPVSLENKVSTNNSTTTPLGIGGVFTGVGDDISKYAALTVMVFADQGSAVDGLSVEFSSDNENWDEKETYDVVANEAFTLQPMGEGHYFRIVYTNGGVAQTEFRLHVICKVIPSVGEIMHLDIDLSGDGDAQLVRAVLAALKPNGKYANINATNGGNLKFSLEEFDESFHSNPLPVDTKLHQTAFGELLTGELHPQFQGSFEYTVDNTDLNTNTEVNSGTVTQASGMAVMTTSTTTASSACFQSKQHGRYKSGLGGVDRFTALFTTPVVGTEQFIGLADESGSSEAFKNGYMIGYDDEGVFGFHRFSNDVKFTTALADWDDPLDGTGASGMTLDQTKLNVFFIPYQYLGAGAIHVFVENDATGHPMLMHTELYANLNTEPSTHNPNFHHTMWVDNKATTSNLILKSSSYAYFVEGKTSFIELHQPENSSGKKTKTNVSSEVAIFTIRNKTAYASKANFIDILLMGAGASIEASSANNLGEIRVVKNATLGGTPSWNDINTTNSVVEIDTAGTTVTGGKELASSLLAGKNDRVNRDLINSKIILNPGETLTFAGNSENAAIFNARAGWRELF
jgi:hypothetical protein